MTRGGIAVAFGLVIMASSSPVFAQGAAREDHSVVYELGWAGDWSHAEGWQPRGGTLAFEITPIEHWLELEIGATAIHTSGGTETEADLLFKKPWTLSRRVELMAGIGPELVHADGATFWGFSTVADIMVWPRRNVGVYVEPGYERTFPHAGARNGMAIAAGLLIGR